VSLLAIFKKIEVVFHFQKIEVVFLFQKIEVVFLFQKIACVPVRQWYQLLLERSITQTSEDPDSPPLLVNSSWKKNIQKSTSQEYLDQKSFIFKMMQSLLPNRDRLARMGIQHMYFLQCFPRHNTSSPDLYPECRGCWSPPPMPSPLQA
jgi:hypothetical protein